MSNNDENNDDYLLSGLVKVTVTRHKHKSLYNTSFCNEVNYMQD